MRLARTTLGRLRWTLVLALALAAACAGAPARAARTDRAAEKIGWRLSLQCWTFNQLTLFETIEKAQALGIRYIEMFPGQKLRPDSEALADHAMKPEDREALKRKLKEAGIKVVNYGVVGLGKDEAGSRQVFDFAKEMGIETICSEPSEDAFDTVEKLCDEYHINVAIHNHPKPSHYWDPDTVLAACKGRSKRIGACADTGHWARSAVDPLEALRKLEGRIVTFHFKDLNELSPGAHDVPWGTGASNAKALLAEMRRQRFKGAFSIEYEHNTPELVDNLARCAAFFDQTAAELAR